MYKEFIKVSASSGQLLDNFLREIVILALKEDWIVKGTHNGRLYVVRPTDILETIKEVN